MWRYMAEGGGTFSHLGKVVFEINHCSTMSSPTEGAFGNGTITITARNGDQLYLSHDGTFHLSLDEGAPAWSHIDLQWTVVGGTGRFLDATGEGTGTALGDLAAGTTAGTFRGTISYDASSSKAK